MQHRNNGDALQFAVDNKMIPPYFLGIKDRLQKIIVLHQVHDSTVLPKYLGGGTDLYVQLHDSIVDEHIDFLFDKSSLNGIFQKGNTCEIGAAATVADMANSPVFKKYFPRIDHYIKLVSSTQIRNMATIAGNFTNASPIGDLTIFFLALDARIKLGNGNSSREIQLKDFYKGYKSLDKSPEEIIEKISFQLPSADDLFNFEKVCKRTYLDIASVNTAIHLKMEDNMVSAAGLSAGGVGPIPAYLFKCSDFLVGKRLSAQLVNELCELAQAEISPISDARGTEAYKRLLLSQLIKAHFIKLFPELPVEQFIYS
jgi:xanthine dehydrogenase small subunit